MTLKVFHGVDVVVAEVKGDRVYSLMAIENNVDDVDFSNIQGRFEVDLSMSPKRTANPAKIRVDDRGIDAKGNDLPIETALPFSSPLHITSIGSGQKDSPPRGAFVGRVYLEHTRYMALQATCFPSWPPEVPPIPKLDLAQLTSIWFSDVDAAGASIVTRYHGFFVKVADVQGTQVSLTITEQGNPAPIPFSIDTTKPSNYLAKPPDEAFDKQPSILKNLAKGQEGILFIELKAAVGGSLRGIKVPVGLGK